MTKKVLSQNAAELLLSGHFNLACTACGESNWVKASPADQTKKPDSLTVKCKTCHSAASSTCVNKRYATDEVWREAEKARCLQFQKDNPGKATAKVAKRRSKKLQATPEWADLSAIQAFYEACPEGHHVDHTIPLQGRTVCGLHVLENLQYLTATENLSKGNKHEA
jgi:hypothetical protein